MDPAARDRKADLDLGICTLNDPLLCEPARPLCGRAGRISGGGRLHELFVEHVRCLGTGCLREMIGRGV